MGKYEQKRSRTGRKPENAAAKNSPKKRSPAAKIILILVLVVLLILFAVFVMPQLLYRLRGGESAGEDIFAAEATVYNGPSQSFPCELEDGALSIDSLFRADGLNPDCGDEEGSNTAAIILRNVSEEYLSEAKVTMTLSDGTTVNFLITDLPAGKTSMAFSTENISLPADASCINVSCESVFDAEASMETDKVSLNVDGMMITLTNISGTELNEVVVYCHSILSPDYFGGITYKYVVNNLAPGADATVNAIDCIIGMAEVVRVEVNE